MLLNTPQCLQILNPFFTRVHLIAMVLLCSLAATANAEFFFGDEVEGSLIRTPGNASFNDMAISGTAIVVDPGVEFQGEAFALGSATIDAFVDIGPGELTIGFFRTDNSLSDFGAGSASTLTWTISDIDWTGNDIELEFVESTATSDSEFGDDPQDFSVTTTPTSIQIDWTGGFILRDSGELTVRYSVSSVPEPTTTCILLFAGGTLFARSRRR